MKAKCFILLFVTTLSLQLFAGDMEYYFWKGKINGSDVKLACAVKDGVMTGEMLNMKLYIMSQDMRPTVCMISASTMIMTE